MTPGRKAALDALPSVARTGTHLFTFVKYAEQFRGWGRGLRNRAIAHWYEGKDNDQELAYQLVKYRQRDGWTHRDLLRLSHPAHRLVFSWAAGAPEGTDSKGRRTWTTDALPPIIQAYLAAQAIGAREGWTPMVTANPTGDWVQLIRDNPSLSWEMLPDAALTSPDVWRALIEAGMPQTALMRQLPRLTKLGVIGLASLATTALVAAQLADRDRLTYARVHPVNVLVALRTYAGGHGMRGSMEWTPVPQITDALDAAFYTAFGAIEPSGKRIVNALDVSGSMTQSASGLPISCREATAALSLVSAATEPSTVTVGFTSALGWNWGGGTAITPLNISPRQRLDDAIRTVSGLSFGGTDCALPMLWALQNRIEVDTFHVFTDNETWAGNVHPHQALEQYRQQMGINARLAVVGMTATDFTIADPEDTGTLDVAGFDSAVPSLLASFGRGDV